MAKGKVLPKCPSMINSRNFAQNMGINSERLTLIILVDDDFIIIEPL